MNENNQNLKKKLKSTIIGMIQKIKEKKIIREEREEQYVLKRKPKKNKQKIKEKKT